MKFGRSRKFYILFSFGFVLILFFFSHWRTFKILDQDNEKQSLFIQEMNLRKRESGNDEKTREEKCRSENGVQISGHCMNKGDYKKKCGLIYLNCKQSNSCKF